MKILKIELHNNLFFKDTTFDFCDEKGKPFNNVVIAGENGSGKTQFLNLIYDLSLFDPNMNLGKTEKRVFHIRLTKEEVNRYKEKMKGAALESPTSNFKITFDGSKEKWEKIDIQYEFENASGKNWKTASHPSGNEHKDAFKTVFSTAEVSYTPRHSSSVTSKDLDEDFTSSLKSTGDLATDIQQLLIDVRANDDNDLGDWVENNPNKIPPDSIKNKRISRFRKAFSSVFDNMNFEKIKTGNGKKSVIFQKGGMEIDIASLSSGEKQIVFRGAFLLQHQQASIGYPVLIDEPEISLHPRWQKRIFDYYRKLCIARNNVQTSQMFMTTHSQYVLEVALQDDHDTAVFLMKSTGSLFDVKKMTAPFVLPIVTTAELNYEAFNIVSRDYHNELYGYVQKLFRADSVKKTDAIIVNCNAFDKSKHTKMSHHGNVVYNAKTTYIRNIIDHPDYQNNFTESELAESIELLRRICDEKKKGTL